MSTTGVQPYHGSYLMPSFRNATVADAMHPGIMAVDPDTSAMEVARIMATHHVHCVVVMGNTHSSTHEPRVWGIVTDIDLLERGVGADAETMARGLANTPIVSVKPTMALSRAREVMLSHRLSHVIVEDPETLRPIGVLSTLDLAGVFAWGET